MIATMRPANENNVSSNTRRRRARRKQIGDLIGVGFGDFLSMPGDAVAIDVAARRFVKLLSAKVPTRNDVWDRISDVIVHLLPLAQTHHDLEVECLRLRSLISLCDARTTERASMTSRLGDTVVTYQMTADTLAVALRYGALHHRIAFDRGIDGFRERHRG